ncbi:hypothetical protein [Nostoc sp.]|uniref:hypothetical protein n=1 Tax=Nostoc sp. TaxID=1180 RepID=UPI002FF99516
MTFDFRLAVLASSILSESIQEKLGQIRYSSGNKSKFAVNPLGEMQPYAYSADPNEPIISDDDWEMNQGLDIISSPEVQ